MAAFSASGFSPAAFDFGAFDFGAVVREEEERYGGGKRRDEDEAWRVREHWDYIESLRAVAVTVADDVRGSYVVPVPLDMAVPDALVPRAMRGTFETEKRPATVADMLGNPLVLAALALMIDELDD